MPGRSSVRVIRVGLTAISRRTISPLILSMTKRSGVTSPETSGSPSPQTASQTTVERSPLAGLSVMNTPAARAVTISWTTTAMAPASPPARCR